MTSADPIRVLHTLEPEFGWHFVSPDVDGMVGGGSTYDESRQRAEYLVGAHIRSDGDAHDRSDRLKAVRFAHFVDERAAALPREPEETSPLLPSI